MDSTTYERRVMGIVNAGLVSLALSLGKDTGLIDVLCRKLDAPATKHSIAEKANLKSRYVQEWLGCMVAASVVQVEAGEDSDDDKYFVPEDCRQHLTMAAEMAPFVVLLGKRKQRVEECFQLHGPNGFKYSDFPEIFDLISSQRKEAASSICKSDLLPAVKSLIPHLEEGCWVIDIGCGTGEILSALASKFPHSSFIGIENSKEAIDKANHNVRERGILNVTLEETEAHALPEGWCRCFDWVIVYDVLHDLQRPRAALAQIRRIMKDDGVLSVIEVGVHSKHSQNAGSIEAAGSYTFSMYSCLPSSLGDNESPEENVGIGVENIRNLIDNNGFTVTKLVNMVVDSENVHLICKKNLDYVEDK